MKAHRVYWHIAVIALAIVGLGVSNASATIIGTYGGWSISMPADAIAAGQYSGAVVQDSLVRDRETGQLTLVIEIFKIFKGRISELGDMPAIPITFNQIAADVNTASKIVIADETVVNRTNFTWWDYHYTLVSPDGPGLATFNQAQTFNPADPFDINPFTQHAWSQSADGYSQELALWGSADGIVPLDSFTPGAAGGSLVIDVNLGDGSPTNGDGSGPRTFVFKQRPSVPEPLTMALLGIGGLLTLSRRRARA